MTILIANIGTSDLAVRLEQPLKKLPSDRLNEVSLSDRDLEQDYYLPIGFDRSEPNLEEEKAKLNSTERLVWDNRQCLIALCLCDLLRVEYHPSKYTFLFRDLTNCLLKEYQKNHDYWHDRLRPGRIAGVIKTALTEKVQKGYIFVTDQPKIVDGKENPGYNTDSIHLFELLQAWSKREYGDRIELLPVTIPPHVPAIDMDGLLEEYYQFFNRLETEDILVSVKGGTPQMMTALRVQAIASRFAKQIYLEPRLSITNLLKGQSSECDRISYWRTQRTQKYQAVKQLLDDRWDFEGARVILQGWVDNLKNLEGDNITDIAQVTKSRDRLNIAIQALAMAVSYLNLDYKYASVQAYQGLTLNNTILSPENWNPFQLCRMYNIALNLYTRCRMFWKLERIADFLTGIGSFYEEVLHEIIRLLGNQYLHTEENYWYIYRQDLPNPHWNVMIQRMGNLEHSFERWYNQQNGDEKYRLGNRIRKRSFVQALIDSQDCDRLVKAMEALDYWCDQRNALIHDSEGVSKERLEQVQRKDCNSQDQSVAQKACKSCLPKDILTQMSSIYKDYLIIVKQKLDNPDYLNPNGSSYYIYSDVATWVKEILDRDR